MLSTAQKRLAWLFVLPTLAAVTLVAFYPLSQVFRYAFTDAWLSGTSSPQWVGLQNFRDLLQDPDFLASVRNTLFFTVVSVSLEAVLGMAIALALHASFPGRGLLRAAVLVPWAIPTVVSAQMWKWMLHDIYGVVNLIGTKIGLLSHKVAWIAQPGTAMASIIVVDIWKTTPFVVLMLLAGLQMIPRELYEAAKVDGASAWQQFRKITFPLLRPILLVTLVFRTLDALRVFDVIYVMTGGGNQTESMALYNRRVLVDFQELGYGSAISIAILLIISVFVVIYLYLMRRGVYE